ncbi:MAG: DUF2064 domain-containing protein [Candidatus Lokiarchaeota archaeon]|nr:DUF2064 domain-containing protein [Candidatus Lokiarchaeota archaeon]
MTTKRSVIIFTKVPITGLVKTRLSQTSILSDIEVGIIAEEMLKDTIIIASRSKADIIEIGYYPEEHLDYLEKIVDSIKGAIDKSIPINYHLQKGISFDERFESVVQASIENGNESIVVLGADLPYMPASLINSAFSELTSINISNKVVIGPTGEGGIYLVGFSRNFSPTWFPKYKLFTNGVEIIQFAKFCKLEKIELKLLTPLIDIDIEEDLVSLLAFIEGLKEGLKVTENDDNYHYPHYTTQVLESLGLYIEVEKGKTRKRKIGKYTLRDSIAS